MARVQTIGELEEYIFRKLGRGVVNVEVSPDQLKDCIEDTLQVFLTEAYEGYVEKYHVLDTSVKAQAYTLPNDIIAVLDVIWQDQGFGGAGDYLWSVQNILVQDGLLNPHLLTGSVSYLYSVKEYLSTLNFWLKKDLWWDFNPITHQLYLQEDAPRDYLILRVFESIAPDSTPDIYNHKWVKEYSTALAKEQWAQNLTKFTVQLPGGAQLNSEALKSEAREDLERLRTELEDKYTAPLDFWVE